MKKKTTVSDLLKQVPDRYEMILTVSKRSRELKDGAQKMTRFSSPNFITVASHEVAEGLVKPTKSRKGEYL